jgi:hypothetical protein
MDPVKLFARVRKLAVVSRKKIVADKPRRWPNAMEKFRRAGFELRGKWTLDNGKLRVKWSGEPPPPGHSVVYLFVVNRKYHASYVGVTDDLRARMNTYMSHKGSQSVWIRNHIVKVLTAKSEPGTVHVWAFHPPEPTIPYTGHLDLPIDVVRGLEEGIRHMKHSNHEWNRL